jgi:tRNA uridine 5-carboxymethylaminomethyl modification enzyme
MYRDRGPIEGIGPRYCPSIEDKIHRFADKKSHQVFLEPEGASSCEIYPNGISTSLPFDVQYELVRSLPGLGNARIMRPGYAIEYDYFDPRHLHPWFETRDIGGLFFAGQINGTTGYEEAAAQGLYAGANAALQALGRAPWTLERSTAYLGVLADDLVTKGVTEPYRMFTSRAEYRLSLREDNADQRLTEVGRTLGLVDDARWAAFCRKRDAVAAEIERLRSTHVSPAVLDAQAQEAMSVHRLDRHPSLLDLLKRPGVSYAALMDLKDSGGVRLAGPGLQDAVQAEQVDIQVKYAGYVERQSSEIERQRMQTEQAIPDDFDYEDVTGLSIEVRQRLKLSQPRTVGQAGRISGVTPAAISLLLVHLKRHSHGRKAA